MRGAAWVIILVCVCIIAIGMLGFIFFVSSNHNSAASSDASAAISPTIPVKDFAPNLPITQKTTVMIQHSDSSFEKYVIPTNEVDMIVKNLPEGDHVVSK